MAGKSRVGIIMGSSSDLTVMAQAAEFLDSVGIPSEVTIVSAHRTPDRAAKYAATARDRGLLVIIAGAGGAAHLAGVVASLTTLPVIAVPIKSENSIDGWDSILSVLQMPSGIPVATVGLNAARNAGILAAEIIGVQDPAVAEKLRKFKKDLSDSVEKTAAEVEQKGYRHFLKPKG